jgi:membrane protease YdiL (CAAX protease family)
MKAGGLALEKNSISNDSWRLGWALLALLLLLSVEIFLGGSGLIRWMSIFLLVAALYRREWDMVPCAFLLFYLFIGGLYLPNALLRLPAANFLAPFALTAITCLPFPPLRPAFRWFRKGSLDQVTNLLVVLTSLISALALILWALWTDYLGLGTAMLGSVKSVPRWFLLLIGIPGFALMNAFAEEVVYRGMLLDALLKRFPGRVMLVIVVQASAFAAAHYIAGFPNGKIGYLMTFTYASMLGYLRIRTEGMLAPYVAHVAADAVIGFTLLALT